MAKTIRFTAAATMDTIIFLYRGFAVIFITDQPIPAMAVGDHLAVFIRGAIAADFGKRDKTLEEITDLMAGW